MRPLALFLSFAFGAPLAFPAESVFDSQQVEWTLGNSLLTATVRLTPGGQLAFAGLSSSAGDRWAPAPGLPVLLQTSDPAFSPAGPFFLIDQHSESITPSGIRQYIVLQNQPTTARITVLLEIYDNQPVLHYALRYRNLTSAPVYISQLDLLPWSFPAGAAFTAFRVNQWSGLHPIDFEPLETALEPSGAPVQMETGADGNQCAWLAVRDPAGRGLFAGWEFDGRVAASVQSGDSLRFSAALDGIHHPVAPGAEFQTPFAFLGLFHGDWDEAGYRTRQFAEAVLARPAPGPQFPYVSWDSWAYDQQIDEATLRRNAEIAASLGVELFTLDLGWARAIGDWTADPQKFPHGLAALADYVHSLGMKFGLHFPLAEADPASTVLQANPDWTSSENDGYFGASSLCLSHQPVRQWLVDAGIRMIDQYHVDWILQDGANMVKRCTKTTHTHDPQDSNYSNAVEGLNAVIGAIQSARPHVAWENCEDGGNMMTFNMVKTYVTSITNDATGSVDARKGLYGASYPFPLRYTERYMAPVDGIDPYDTHSYMLGGPWVVMNRLPDLTSDQLAFLARQIREYKEQRAQFSGSQIYHLQPPQPDRIDVIQSFNPDLDSGLAVVSRPASVSPGYTLLPRGLDPLGTYTVHFDGDPAVYQLSGQDLMEHGVAVALPAPFTSEIVHIDPQQPHHRPQPAHKRFSETVQ
ncbi:MAG TPA: alpha-galactosidase [Bryobacteraceae bacterium]|nr:alpha-galactosidase [Bryobacteraceae bacterium]